jgi:hypothetical protein
VFWKTLAIQVKRQSHVSVRSLSTSIRKFPIDCRERDSRRRTVTAVPKFLFSEQKLKMLPRVAAYAMFSTRNATTPVARKTIENRVVIR